MEIYIVSERKNHPRSPVVTRISFGRVSAEFPKSNIFSEKVTFNVTFSRENVTFSRKMWHFQNSRNYRKIQSGNPGRFLCPNIVCIHTVNHEPLSGARFRGRREQFEKTRHWIMQPDRGSPIRLSRDKGKSAHEAGSHCSSTGKLFCGASGFLFRSETKRSILSLVRPPW